LNCAALRRFPGDYGRTGPSGLGMGHRRSAGGDAHRTHLRRPGHGRHRRRHSQPPPRPAIDAV